MRQHYSIVTGPTPKRDIDLFGPTTVRIDGSREPGTPGAPVIYLSAYVDDAPALAQRICAAMAWLDDTQTLPNHRPQVIPQAQPEPEISPYALPDYVEDVDWLDRLYLPEDLHTTDWAAWAMAMKCRVGLATSSTQLATLEEVNATGLRHCPARHRAPLGRYLHARYIETDDQAAA